ncbi:MAG: hypothetical protein R3D03_01475 [Geminicoccaceae bacterium]
MVTLAFPFAIICANGLLCALKRSLDAMILGTVTRRPLRLLPTVYWLLHRGMWRYATLQIVCSGKICNVDNPGVLVLAMFFLDRLLSNVPRSVLIIMWLLAIVGLCGLVLSIPAFLPALPWRPSVRARSAGHGDAHIARWQRRSGRSFSSI